MTTRRPWKLAVSCALISCASGCAEQREPINRVQPNALDKAFFIGDLQDPTDDPEFFSRNFVVDASMSQELVGLSQASGLERIRWHVTENMLFARRAYAVVGGDDKGTGDDPNGDVLAAFEIRGHFDIRHAYNPSTGEELNIVEEISSDRPWNERQYFRVDWSKNLVNTPAWTSMFYGQTFGQLKLMPISYFESDPNSPNAPHFDVDDGYFDVTSHFLVEPETIDLGWFDLPLCMLMGLFTGSAVYSCDPQEAVVRTSYWRVDRADPDDDFEPLENTQAALDIVGNPGGIGDSASLGIVTPPRETYDPGYLFTDAGMRRYMNVHDLWDQSHQTIGSCETDDDCERRTRRAGSVCLASKTCSVPCNYAARGDTSGARGTDDQCENEDTRYQGSEGSQCSARNRCTIPYRDRSIAPVAYYVNPEMPDELQDRVVGRRVERGPTEDLVFTWNQALQLAVARAREVECRRTGGARRDCHERYFVTRDGRDEIQMISHGGWGVETPKDDAPVLVTCHNPVRDYDHSVCGPAGSTARVGDVRKHFVIYWPYNTQAPYGGIGNWRGDPLTGMILGAAATTMGPSTTTSAARVRDIAMVALGELDVTDITGGVAAWQYQKLLRDGRQPRAMTNEEIEQRLRSIDFAHSSGYAQFDLAGLPEHPKEALAALRSNLIVDPGMANRQLIELDALAKPLRNSQLEAHMITSNWLVDAVGISPNTQLTSSALDWISPLRSQDPGRLAELDKQLFGQLGRRGICHLEQFNTVGSPDLIGVGYYYRQKYPDVTSRELAELIYEDVWKETYKGIQLHEIGHSLGLLHNFTSSYDSQNYNPQYWQLRTHGGASSVSCNGQPRPGDPADVNEDTCMGPRYLDPETDDERGMADEPRPGIHYFGHTSAMEYQNTRFFETVGLGQYDVMAMGVLYGRVLQTYDADYVDQTRQGNYERLVDTQLSEELRGSDFTGFHYTELARQLQLFDPDRCRDASAEERERAEWRIVHGKVCMSPSKDYGHWDDFVDVADPVLSPRRDLNARKMRIPSGADAPAAGNVRWPYRFGGDMMNSYLHVNPFDSGADPYEVTMETILKNEYTYVLSHFRGGRRTWMSWSLPSYTARMFYERLRSYHWGISFTNAFYGELTQRQPRLAGAIEQLRRDDNELRPFLMAQGEMLKAITANFLVPEPGGYANEPHPERGVYDLESSSAVTPLFSLDASSARYLSPSFDSGPSAGGSWLYHDYTHRAGYTVEKTLASRALTDGRAVFFSTGREIYLDGRNININFRSDFPVAVDRLIGGVLAEDWKTIAPYILGTQDPVVYPRDIASTEPSALPVGAKELFPNIGYNQQLPTIVYAYLFGRANGDLTLVNKIRIWLEGSISGELDVPEAEQVRFSDPESGITYIARRFGPETLYGREVDKGIGSRMLEQANAMLARTYRLETDAAGNPVYDEFGRPALQRDEAGAPIPTNNATTRTRLRRYVGLLDANVQIGTLLGHGPFN